MSLIITIANDEGIIMASDSRLTDYSAENHSFSANSHLEYKLCLLENQCGVAYCGWSSINEHYVSYWLEKFSAEKIHKDTTIADTADLLDSFFNDLEPEENIIFHLARYELGQTNRSRKIMRVLTGRHHEIQDIKIKVPLIMWDGVTTNVSNYLCVLGDELRQHIKILTINDCCWTTQQAIEKAKLLMNLTITSQILSASDSCPQSVGEPIDILQIKPQGCQWIQRK